MDKVFLDRDAVIERLERLMQLQASTARAIIEAIPAADVRPVVRGGWEEHGEPNEYGKYELWYYSCTRCGAVGVPEFNFCPNCGADMREES